MKIKYIKLLTILGVTSLIGSAFAAWTYSGEASQDINVGIEISNYSSTGIIKITTSNAKLHLDKENSWLSEIKACHYKDDEETEIPDSACTGIFGYKQFIAVIPEQLQSYLYFYNRDKVDGTWVTIQSEKSYPASWSNNESIIIPNIYWKSDIQMTSTLRDEINNLIKENDLKITITFKASINGKVEA